MQRYKRLAAIVAAAMGMTVAGVLQAQDTFGGYIGASAGQTDTDDNDLDSSTGYRLFGGYMFTPMYGVEVGYLDSGDFDGKGQFSNISVEGNGAYVAGVGSYPVSDRFRVFGKLGFFHFEYDVNQNGNVVENDDGTELYLGVGVDYAVTPSVAIGAEYNQVDLDVADADAFWVNIQVDLDGQ